MTIRFNEERLKARATPGAPLALNPLHFPYQTTTVESFTHSCGALAYPPPQIGPLKPQREAQPKGEQ